MHDHDQTQAQAERLVQNEVYVCLSSLVATLAQGAFQRSAFGASGKELDDMCDQAFELASPVLDYEEAARQAGWNDKGVVNGTWWHANADYAEGSEDEAPFHYAADAEEACEQYGLDPYKWEVFEHWAVSTHLAEALIEVGEKVDLDFAGMCVWARTCTGQAISMDSSIARVLALQAKRVADLMAEANTAHSAAIE